MNPAEFANIDRCEREMWWFLGMEAILLDRLRDLARGQRIERVAEIGCGTGHMASTIERSFGWRMTAGDLSAPGLRYARTKGLRDLVQLDMRRLPFADGRFDAVLVLDAVAHLAPEETPAAFEGFRRILRPGGVLVVRASALNLLRSRHSEFVQETQRLTASRLRLLCQQAGLQARRLTYVNSLLFPVALFKFRVWEPLTRARPGSGVQMPPPWMNRLLGWPLAAERAMLNAGLRLPIGQSLLLIAERPTQ